MKVNPKLIEERIDKLGLTQGQFAEKAGISARTVYTILQSGEIKKEEQIKKFSEVLNLTLDELTADSNQTMIAGDFEKEDLYKKVILLQEQLILAQQRIIDTQEANESADQQINRYRK